MACEGMKLDRTGYKEVYKIFIVAEIAEGIDCEIVE